jgi:hypothetical protein
LKSLFIFPSVITGSASFAVIHAAAGSLAERGIATLALANLCEKPSRNANRDITRFFMFLTLKASSPILPGEGASNPRKTAIGFK